MSKATASDFQKRAEALLKKFYNSDSNPKKNTIGVFTQDQYNEFYNHFLVTGAVTFPDKTKFVYTEDLKVSIPGTNKFLMGLMVWLRTAPSVTIGRAPVPALVVVTTPVPKPVSAANDSGGLPLKSVSKAITAGSGFTGYAEPTGPLKPAGDGGFTAGTGGHFMSKAAYDDFVRKSNSDHEQFTMWVGRYRQIQTDLAKSRSDLELARATAQTAADNKHEKEVSDLKACILENDKEVAKLLDAEKTKVAKSLEAEQASKKRKSPEETELDTLKAKKAESDKLLEQARKRIKPPSDNNKTKAIGVTATVVGSVVLGAMVSTLFPAVLFGAAAAVVLSAKMADGAKKPEK